MQWRTSRTDTVLALWLATYRVPVDGSRSATVAPAPAGRVASGAAHPEVSPAEQCAMPMTCTVSPDASAPGPLAGTYRVWRAASSVGNTGPSVAGIDATTAEPQPDR